jgi:bile acid:Na+ symporter, BASS family
MKDLNTFVRHNLGIILLVSAIAGLWIPTGKIETTPVIIISLAAIIFTSYFQIEFTRRPKIIKLFHVSVYILIRFLLLPLILYYPLHGIFPFYATALFLLFLLPAAVSSPAFTTLFGGNAGLSLKILVITSFLSIAVIPGMCQLILGQSVNIDTRHMFLIMVCTILIPFVFHLPLRPVDPVKKYLIENNPLITVTGLSVIFIVSVSKNQDIILSNPVKMLVYSVISVVIYLVLYISGFYINRKVSIPDRVAYSVCSGANNIGLGVTITAVFFPGETNVFFIIAQLSWIFALIPIRKFFRKAGSLIDLNPR